MCLPALNLFLFNIILVNLIKGVKRIANDNNESGSIWDYVPLVGELMTGKDLPGEQSGMHSEFSKNLLNWNVMINAILLSSFFVKSRRMILVLGLVITWNIFIFERILAFQLMLIWSLWFTGMTWSYYAIILGVLMTMNFIYLKLISQTIKLQRRCFHVTVPKDGKGEEMEVRESVPDSIEGPIGDGST
ncbi:uncharacterized protein LOC117784253 [Drosophila innubila]|uniref:uncharacterized protein LOC117784253 n=1 Tax=Drosophila innubila TaxID=198719 RepID=UPI00148B650B|nr:uncharacterized protein LOC117784253 [Drosophila innubila]